MSQRSLSFEFILLPDGLARDKCLRLDDKGHITAVEAAGGGPHDGWLAIPGMVNAHSHAFQRALTGHGERSTGEHSFWGWRESMYRLAGRVTPDDLAAIAAQAYTDMLRGGFTSVAEFHYLHHLPDGGATRAMAQALKQAADDTGIRLFLLPVFYAMGGFGEPARPSQARFIHGTVDGFLKFVDSLGPDVAGIAPHSLRAVPAQWLADLVAGTDQLLGAAAPLHIHISEQRREVTECVARHGTTPIRLLADSTDLSSRWSLVHATHATERERELLRDSGANLVLCPLTEAYLGDGVFPAMEHAAAGGRFAIGSDSNTRIDPVEELRLAEYAQRLVHERRPCLADGDGLGIRLWSGAARAGGHSVGAPLGRLAAGYAADLVVLDPTRTPLAGVSAERALDALIIGGGAGSIGEVYVGGRRLVQGGQSSQAGAVAAGYAAALGRLALDT